MRFSSVLFYQKWLDPPFEVAFCREEPQVDVLATIVIDCVGDCVLPRLTVDKKGSPDVVEFPMQNKELDDVGLQSEPLVVNAPVFKFLWPATWQEGG